MDKLEDILYLWQTDLAFRIAFQEDPLAALKAKNIVIDPKELKKITSKLHLDDSSIALEKKINK